MKLSFVFVCSLYLTENFVGATDSDRLLFDPSRKGKGLTPQDLSYLNRAFNAVAFRGRYAAMRPQLKRHIGNMAIEYLLVNLYFDVDATVDLMHGKINRVRYMRNLASLLFIVEDDVLRAKLVDEVVKQLDGKRRLQEELVESYAFLRSNIDLVRTRKLRKTF